MAGERELEAAAHAHAIDGDGEALARGLELAEDQRQLPGALEEAVHGDLFALCLGDARIALAEGLQHRQVRAAGEPVLAGGDDGARDGGVARNLGHEGVDLRDHLGIQHVHRAPGHVPGDERDSVGVGFKAEIGEVHGGGLHSNAGYQGGGMRKLKRMKTSVPRS